MAGHEEGSRASRGQGRGAVPGREGGEWGGAVGPAAGGGDGCCQGGAAQHQDHALQVQKSRVQPESCCAE